LSPPLIPHSPDDHKQLDEALGLSVMAGGVFADTRMAATAAAPQRRRIPEFVSAPNEIDRASHLRPA